MTFKSIIDPSTDIETLFDSKNRVVAVYEKGKCKKVIDRLCFTPLHGYYEAKDTSYYKYYDSLVEPNREDINIGRCCTNKDEYLKATPELKYHKFRYDIFGDPYKEKQWRLKYNRQIEILEKSDIGYWWLLDKKSVLELNKNDLRKYIKLFGLYYDVKNSMNAFKKGFTDYYEYLHDRDIRQVMSKLHFDKKTAKYFIKSYGVRVFAGNLKAFITLYQDTLNLAKELGINEIGFPSDLRAYEQHLIELKQKKDLKITSNRIIKAVKGIAICLNNKILKNYNVEVLNTPRKIKEIAIEFHNCIYSNYLQEVVKGNYIIGLISKDNNAYACVGYRNGKLDQLYGKFNKSLPQDEYKKITRSLKLVRI